jgi:hypothetical protein
MSKVAMGVSANAFDGSIECGFSSEIGKELPIADAAHGRGVLWYSTPEERLDFINQTAVDLIVDPTVDRGTKVVARHGEGNFEGIERRRALPLLV